MNVMQETQKIAAVVLFKDLHAKQMNVYDVLAAFISDIIVDKGLTKFSNGYPCLLYSEIRITF